MLGVIFHRGIFSPIAIHFFIWAIFNEAESPTVFLVFSLAGTFFVGILLAAVELPLAAVAALSAVFPAFTSWSDLYWKLDGVSPHSSELLKVLPLPGRWAYVVASALAGAAAWLLCRDRGIRNYFKYFSWRDVFDE